VGYSPQAPALKFLHAPADGWYVPMLAFIDRNGMMRYENIVSDTDDGTAGKFIESQEVNIPNEINKYLKAPKS
jgi:hypothetical protein